MKSSANQRPSLLRADSREREKRDKIRGRGGPPHFFVYPKFYFFGDLKPHAKFQNKYMIHKLVRVECVRQRNEVAIILGIIFSFSLSLRTFCSEQTWSLIG